MKIRIIKEIPGFEVGKVIEDMEVFTYAVRSSGNRMPHCGNLTSQFLIEKGFAEEITDDIDIEKIRQEEDVKYFSLAGADIKPSESEFLQAFRVVSRVIKELNGDWEADWNNDGQEKWNIEYDRASNKFLEHDSYHYQKNIIPVMAEQVVDKVIELCEPELKTLFHIK